MEPASPGTLVRALAFVHPLWMVGTLALAIATARLGLRIRHRRRRGEAPGRSLRARHLRFGKLTLVAVFVGFVMGPMSMVWLRDRALLDSFHGVLGLIVAGLFAWTGWSGRALARGRQDLREIHRWVAAASLLAGLLAAVAGFRLLP